MTTSSQPRRKPGPAPTGKRLVVTPVRLSKQVVAALDRARASQDLTRSKAIRGLVTQWLRQSGYLP